MTANSLHERYVEQLQDLYDAEHQIVKALPKMIETAQTEEPRSALNEHLEITRNQASGRRSSNEKCKGMEGVIKEGSELLKKVSNEVRDVAIIAAAQRVEHYEMAGYGTARTYATPLGYDEAARLLQQTLEEEKEADKTLLGLAEKLNVQALEATEKVAERGEEAQLGTAGKEATCSQKSGGLSAKRALLDPIGGGAIHGSLDHRNTADTVWTGRTAPCVEGGPLRRKGCIMKVLGLLGKIGYCLAVCAVLARADSIQLRDGRHLQGKYLVLRPHR